MQKLKRPVSVILSILMVVSMFVVVPFTASAEVGDTVSESECLTFTAVEAGSSVTLKVASCDYLQYNKNNSGWQIYTPGSPIALASAGDYVRFRGKNTTFDSDNHVSIGGKVACSGNVMSLRLDDDGRDQGLSERCFYYMFADCAGLTAAPELPETILAENCYDRMFLGCTSLTTAPALPATALANNCYDCMFIGCTSLTTAPVLPATTLARYCYNCMFYGCESLTTAPVLPATTLEYSCYSNMFYGCKSLTTAPELPATELADYCYSNMFYDCKSLTTAPELPATTLAPDCYGYMFYGCSSIKLSETQTDEYSKEYRVPSKGTGTTASSYNLYYMFARTGGTFKGTPDINKTYYVPANYVAKIDNTKYETLEDAFAAAVDGDTITLLADCAGNGIKAPQGKFTNGLTVDFAGKTYTVDGETVGSTGTETNGFQLLKNNKITFKNGTITSEKAKILVQNYSNLTLEGMTLTLNNPSYAYAYTLSNNNGDVVIDDTTINANPAGGFAFDVCRYASYPSVNVTVTGDSEINGNVEVFASNGQAKDGFSLTLESGTMTGDIVLDQTAKNVIANAPEKISVTKASTFNQEAPEGYMWVDTETEGVQTIAKAVAQIGTTKYATLEAAFAAAQDGQTITLLADCAGNGIKAPQGKFGTNGLTVDFAGHTYTVDGETVGSTGTETNGFQLLKDNKITFENGTITSTKAKILVQNYSNLTLEGMTLTLNNPSYAYAYTLSNNNGDVVIDGSTINANPAGGFAFDVCRYASYPSVNVTVKGDSEINGNVEVYASNGQAKDGFSLTLESGTMTGNIVVDPTAAAAMGAAPEKVVVTKADTFNQDAPEGYVWVDTETEGVQTIAKAVAQIGTTKYATLEAAFAAAQDGNTITLLANCAGNGIKAPQGKFGTNGLTVDFAGHTYTVDGETVGSTGTETNGFQLLKGNKITFENGTITSTKAKILVQNYSDLTLDNMTLTLNNPNYTSAYTLSDNNGEVVIKDTTINANPAGGFAFDVCRYSSYPSVNVTVTGDSEINGNVEVYASNGQAKDGFSLTLESGTLNGNIVVDKTAAAAMAAAPDKAEVDKATGFTAAAPAGYMWVADATDGGQTLAKAVAEIDGTSYATLEAAFAAAQDGDTITVLADSTGNGIKVPQGKFGTNGLTVDFGGHKYTVDANTVGSTGTETQGFQLLKGNKITFQNGAITGDTSATNSLLFLIQNYSDLTLDKMDLSLKGQYYGQYTLSNNNGEIVINDSTINAPDYTWIDPSIKASDVNSFAFDVCRYSSYPSVNVTVTGNSTINGDVEISASKSDAKDGFSLTLESGTLNGNIVLDATAKTAMAAAPEKAKVTKADTFTQAAPAGYEWVSNGDGTSTLKVQLFTGHSINLGGDIGVNFFINSRYPALANANSAKVRFTWDDEYTAEVDLKALTPDATTGYYKATVDVVAAHMNHPILAEIIVNGTQLTGKNEKDEFTVKAYADELYAHPEKYVEAAKTEELQTLAKALLNYGSEAQEVFKATLNQHPERADTNVGTTDYSGVTSGDVRGAINGQYTENLKKFATDELKNQYFTNSLIYLSKNTLRIYFIPPEGKSTMPNSGAYDGHKLDYYYYVQKTNIAAAELDNVQTFNIAGKSFSYSPLNYVADVIDNGNMSTEQKNLAKSVFLYNQAANAYFG